MIENCDVKRFAILLFPIFIVIQNNFFLSLFIKVISIIAFVKIRKASFKCIKVSHSNKVTDSIYEKLIRNTAYYIFHSFDDRIFWLLLPVSSQWCESTFYRENCSKTKYLDRYFFRVFRKFIVSYTAWKMSVFGVFLVRIFPHSDWIRKDTEYLSVFSQNAGKDGSEKLRIWTLLMQC